jgi:hypothetical protein
MGSELRLCITRRHPDGVCAIRTYATMSGSACKLSDIVPVTHHHPPIIRYFLGASILRAKHTRARAHTLTATETCQSCRLGQSALTNRLLGRT